MNGTMAASGALPSGASKHGAVSACHRALISVSSIAAPGPLEVVGLQVAEPVGADGEQEADALHVGSSP